MGLRVQSLQCAWFTPLAPSSAQELFQLLIGDAPSSSNAQKLPNGQQASFAEGAAGQFSVSIQVQPGRTDLFLTPQMTAESALAAFPVVPLFDDPETSFAEAARLIAAFPDVGGVHRVAMVCNLAELFGSPTEAAQSLMAEAKLEMPVSDIDEFFLRVNKRRASEALPEVVLNRLLAWKVETIQLVTMGGGPHSTFSAHASPQAMQQFNAGLTVDINTAAPPKQPFTRDQWSAIFDEVTRETKRLALDGTLSGLNQ